MRPRTKINLERLRDFLKKSHCLSGTNQPIEKWQKLIIIVVVIIVVVVVGGGGGGVVIIITTTIISILGNEWPNGGCL